MILGSGVIGCEFAFVLAFLGSKATVVEALSRMLSLPWVDEDGSKVLEREVKKHKITFLVNRTVERVEEAGQECRMTLGPSPFGLEDEKREVRSAVVDVDKMLICIGRKLTTAGVGM